MKSFYVLLEDIQLIPSYFGTPGPSFPTPPPFWSPEFMAMYPKDAMQACRKKMETMWTGSSRALEPVSQAVARYVYDWSLDRKNIYKRVIYNAGQRGEEMDNILATARKADQLSQGFKPKYPEPIANLPPDFNKILQMVANKVAS